MNKLKVLGYCRVSSELQKLKDNSVKNQIKFIEDYCDRLNYDLIKHDLEFFNKKVIFKKGDNLGKKLNELNVESKELKNIKNLISA